MEFSAGYASILKLPSLSDTERNARFDHFIGLMYLVTQFTWLAVHELHAAALRNRMQSCTVGWFLFWLQKLDFSETLQGRRGLRWRVNRWHQSCFVGIFSMGNVGTQRITTAQIGMRPSFSCDRKTFGVFCWLSHEECRFRARLRSTILLHHLPDLRPWLDSGFSSLDFTQLHVSWPSLDSRLSCSTPDCNSLFDNRLSACNSQLFETSVIHGFGHCHAGRVIRNRHRYILYISIIVFLHLISITF